MFDGDVQYIEVEGGRFYQGSWQVIAAATKHEVLCEVKRVYTSVVR
jgi:hypothetical protein